MIDFREDMDVCELSGLASLLDRMESYPEIRDVDDALADEGDGEEGPCEAIGIRVFLNCDRAELCDEAAPDEAFAP